VPGSQTRQHRRLHVACKPTYTGQQASSSAFNKIDAMEDMNSMMEVPSPSHSLNYMYDEAYFDTHTSQSQSPVNSPVSSSTFEPSAPSAMVY
jgi:hypothetical protein